VKPALPPESLEHIRKERQQAQQAADVFARVCRDGDADLLYDAHLMVNEAYGNAWRYAMKRVAKLPRVSPEIQNAFISIWVESKMLPLRVGHRPTMAAALRKLMSGGHHCGLTLYRGTTENERKRRLYGFSWTTDVIVARGFAQKYQDNAQADPDRRWTWGIVLRTCAPPEAILLIRQPEDYYDEGEVVVDPFRLTRVEAYERQPF
jgi:hypothetical protein